MDKPSEIWLQYGCVWQTRISLRTYGDVVQFIGSNSSAVETTWISEAQARPDSECVLKVIRFRILYLILNHITVCLLRASIAK